MDSEQLSTHGSFFIIYMVILLVSTLFISLDKYGFEVSFSAALTALNNMGPGLGAIAVWELSVHTVIFLNSLLYPSLS